MALKLPDSAVPMGDFPVAKAVDIDFNDGENLQEKLDNGKLGGAGGGASTYTSLEALGLTAPVTVGEIFNAMPNKTTAVIACEGKEGNTEGSDVHVSDVPVSFGVLTIKKNELGRFSIEYQNSLQGASCNVKRWIGTLKGIDGTGLYWKQLSTEPTFVTLTDIGLTADATIQDAMDAVPVGSTALLRTDAFTNWSTLFDGIQYGYFKVEKTVSGLCNIELQEVVGDARRYFGAQSRGKFYEWKQMITENSDPYICTSYKSLTGTEDLFTLPCGHYFTEKADTAYNYPITDSSTLNAHIYVLGHLNDPTNNQGYRIILYFDNKDRMYRINEWWGKFDHGWQNMKGQYTTLAELGLTAPCTTAQIANALKGIKPQKNVAIAIIDCAPNEVTDVPEAYGLLHIETIGFDRLSVRFDGMASSSCTGSWIGQIKGSGGKFSSVTWSRIDLEAQVNELFQSVSSGKKIVANAITGKGVSTATDATFATMATNISKISGGYKEETKTLIVTSSTTGTEALIFTFSANVIAVKQIVAPSDSSYVVPQTSKDVFAINGKDLVVYVRGSGRWTITALIEK